MRCAAESCKGEAEFNKRLFVEMDDAHGEALYGSGMTMVVVGLCSKDLARFEQHKLGTLVLPDETGK